LQAQFWQNQARSQVLRFGGANKILWGKHFNFYHMFETNFSEHNKIWGAQKYSVVTAPNAQPYLRAWAELSPESLPLGAFRFVQGG